MSSTTLAEREGQIYCKTCYGKQFGPKGFGYGIGAGTLAETSGPSEPIAKAAASPAGPSTQTFSPTSSGDDGSGAAPQVNLSKNPKYTGTDVCPRCDKKVYFAEKVIGAGVSWHKLCFTCIKCRKGLESTTMTENNGQIYCKVKEKKEKKKRICLVMNFQPLCPAGMLRQAVWTQGLWVWCWGRSPCSFYLSEKKQIGTTILFYEFCVIKVHVSP